MRISDWSSDVCSSDLMKLENLLIHCEDMVLIAMATAKDEFILRRLKKTAPDSLWLGATMPRGGSDRRHLAGLNDLADRAGIRSEERTVGKEWFSTWRYRGWQDH